MMHDSDELDLLSLIARFLNKWRWWVSGLILGGVAGLSITYFSPPKYVAQGVMQLGQVGSYENGPDTVRANASASLIESNYKTIARMQTLAFRNAVVDQLVQKKLVDETQRASWIQQLGDTKILQPVKGTISLIEINITANNKDLAQGVVTAMVQTLADRHRSLMQPKIDRLQESLQESQALLHIMEQQYGSKALPSTAAGKSNDFLEMARIGQMGTYINLRQKVLDIEDLLQPPITQPTELLESVDVSNQPVRPRRTSLLFAGMLLGCGIGTLLSFTGSAWRKVQELQARYTS